MFKIIMSIAALILFVGCSSPTNVGAPWPSAWITTKAKTETVITGCRYGVGAVGIEGFEANVGDTVTVACSVITNTRIDAFTIDMWTPKQLTLINSTLGNLDLDFVYYNHVLFEGGVRFGGFGGPAFIEPGEEGAIAFLSFRVDSAGVGSLEFLNLLDNLTTYTACAPPPTGVKE